MRVAALVLGLIVGVGQFFISAAICISGRADTWVMPVLVPLGLIAIAGGLSAWWAPRISGVLLLVAGFGNIIVGLAAVGDSVAALYLWFPAILLLIGGTLALASGRDVEVKDEG